MVVVFFVGCSGSEVPIRETSNVKVDTRAPLPVGAYASDGELVDLNGSRIS